MADCACAVVEWSTALRPSESDRSCRAGSGALSVLTTEPWSPRPLNLLSGRSPTLLAFSLVPCLVLPGPTPFLSGQASKPWLDITLLNLPFIRILDAERGVGPFQQAPEGEGWPCAACFVALQGKHIGRKSSSEERCHHAGRELTACQYSPLNSSVSRDAPDR